MCGITGFINASKSLEDLKVMQKSLIHRGPDSQGYYYENGVGLAHTRLSIIDLSESANQPFLFEHLVLVYNGEIYNYKEIREELKTKDYIFETNSDTEVLIKGFHCWGAEVVHKLIGMFAFSIYNKHSEELYLFRDRLGVKPLFYDSSNKTISFSSELKTFLKYNHNIEYDEINKQWKIGGNRIHKNTTYTVVMTDYLLLGFDIPFLKADAKGIIKITKNKPADLTSDIRKVVISHLKAL